MKAGTKTNRTIGFVLFLTSFFLAVSPLVAAENRVPLSVEPRDAKAALSEPTQEDMLASLLRQQEILRRESFFHFFNDDFLTAATLLRLLEDSAKAPHNPEILNEARLLTGSLYLAWGMHRPAIRIFNELVDVFPPGQGRNRLLVHVERAQYERALYQGVIETYGLLLKEEAFPAMHQAAYFAGMSHYALGTARESLDLFNGIGKESVYFPYAKLASAKSYLVLDEVPEAVRALRELAGLSAGEQVVLRALVEKARLTLGHLLIEQDQFLEAATVLSTVPKESPFYPDALFAKAWAALKNNNNLQALLVFEDLIAWNPTHRYALEALTGVAHAYNRLEVHQTALEHYDRAIQIYAQEEKRLRSFQEQIGDQSLIPGFIASYAGDQSGPLAGFVEGDETLLFWLKQYVELSTLNHYLEQKLEEMDVFEVILSHRQSVFTDFVANMGSSVQYDDLAALRQRSDIVLTRIVRAYNLEQVSVLATAEDANILRDFVAAQEKSVQMGEKLARLKTQFTGSDAVGRLEALGSDWMKTDRWVGIVAGEIKWKQLSELPGRADDLRGGVRAVLNQIAQGEEAVAKLRYSVPRLELEFSGFSERIEIARVLLLQLHRKNIRLQSEIVSPFQSLLLAASDQKLKRLAAWGATAELNQIRILDRSLASQVEVNEVQPASDELEGAVE